MGASRRDFLKAAGGGLAAFALPGRALAGGGVDPVLVVVAFLRGGADGLNLVVPHGDPDYYALRPTVRVEPGDEIDLDGFFGLHPSLAPLHPLYTSGELAFVHATGSHHDSRSHFEAQDFMEYGAPGDPLVGDGWLNRYLAAAGIADVQAGVSLRAGRALSLAGDVPSLAFASVENFQLTGVRAAERRVAIEQMYDAVPSGLLGRTAGGAFSALDQVGTVTRAPDGVYPTSPFGQRLRDAAALIKADIGVRVVAVDIIGWDHHSNELPLLESNATDLADSLAAFHGDLGTDAGRTLTVACSEFGRTAEENGSSGTDHGHGGIMLALGGGVVGGQVLMAGGQWPGLQPQNLFEGRDLAVTTDFRDVFAELLDRHMGLANLAPVFPGFSVSASNYPGLL